MLDPQEVEIRIAVAEGIIAREDAAKLADEARREHCSPLELLVERGRLTADSMASLRGAAASGVTVIYPLDRLDTLHQGGGNTTPATVAEPRFPVTGWSRYSCVRFLGQGAMGKVFLAYDPQLQREVAIKFVLGDNPDHVRRLVSEARAQARVSHDRVCRVHEVGEVDGKVYIAMQYIAGQPLGDIAGSLTTEQKVMLVRGAAEGLHEAHRVGIIHRDIKPSNILVERTEGGELRPYVMDFGLARAAHDDSATLTGAIVGTPRYMSPEQLRAGALDRRADVYSLGATLYHLLTKQPPIAGKDIGEIMHNRLTTEPPPPRSIDPGIPADLEAIVLKAIESDPSARYDSARALADDLSRFLNGEPVVAHAIGAWYRLRKQLSKHRRVVAISAVAAVAVAVTAGGGLKTRHESNERERLARRFTELVERIEATARYSALAPAHDIRADQATLRARMAELADEIQRAGEAGQGPGNYALGRGYLALDDSATARGFLEKAWASGFHEPRVAYALAVVMGRLYHAGQIAADRID